MAATTTTTTTTTGASDDDQSSLDLSLCLRRGSNDSRDSFYMDFDKGIDSDIDVGGPHEQQHQQQHHHHHHHYRHDHQDNHDHDRSSKGLDSLGACSEDDCGDCCIDDDDDLIVPPPLPLGLPTNHHLRMNRTEWVGLRSSSSSDRRHQEGEAVLPPSPVCPARILASPELESVLSSSQTTSSGRLPNGSVRQMGPSSAEIPLICPDHECTRYDEAMCDRGGVVPKDGRLMYACAQKARPKDDNLEDDVFTRTKETDSVLMVLSAMYAKLLIVMGIGFPLSEVISPYIPPSFFLGFYLYLYAGSILFLIYAYSFLLHKSSSNGPGGVNGHGTANKGIQNLLLNRVSMVARMSGGKPNFNNPHGNSSKDGSLSRIRVEEAGVHCGSFYLRMGAVAFGIGSMIYCGLEFGQFFELDPNSDCYSILAAITPCTQMVFIFIQLYFIFMNSKMCIYKFMNVARFGLMHMVATNLCVWLHVLVEESKHEILKFLDPTRGHSDGHPSAGGGGHGLPALNFSLGYGHHRVTRGLKHVNMGFQCRRVNIMGQLVQDVSPFLFPCTIEYSLICAAILYVMWRNIGKRSHTRHNSSVSSEFSSLPSRRHHYSVDCAHANKGLFTGILVLVLAIISLILFFVLISKPEYKDLAVLEAHISELVLYCLNTIAAVIALMQVRELRYSVQHYVELDNILLIVAQTGVYLFAIFCVIGSHFTISRNTILVLFTALANLIQATVQTIFVLDASRRYASTPDQVRRKPGREMITFLLVCNFAMWAINSLEARRTDSNPVQLNFYGFWAWTIISHVSSPLAIFFRFHSTVCLCEIWKKLYKLKAERV